MIFGHTRLLHVCTQAEKGSREADSKEMATARAALAQDDSLLLARIAAVAGCACGGSGS